MVQIISHLKFLMLTLHHVLESQKKLLFQVYTVIKAVNLKGKTLLVISFLFCILNVMPWKSYNMEFKGKILQRLAVAGALIYGFLSLIGSNIIPPIYTVRSDVTISATPERSWKISTQALKRGDCGLLLAPLR